MWLVGKPKIQRADGLAALELWRTGEADNLSLALAVRFTLQELAARVPGSSVEVRVPPYGAVQIIEGTSHTRGTPPAVVEMTSEVWLALATGASSFEDARARGELSASGQRSDLSALLPLVGLI